MISRRRLIQFSLAAALMPAPLLAQAPARRLNWETFRKTPAAASFRAGVKAMRANANAADPASWQFWADIHQGFCPHGKPYLLAWHRGYLAMFEQQLRKAAGDPSLSLPYWDYYRSDVIPADFTDPAPDNSLRIARAGSSVKGALGIAAFALQVTGFQRGVVNAFEPALEQLPHNQVHNLIGGKMASMQSPQDPIFWLHHSNIDRLWAAWLAAGGGRTMPASDSPYWAGTFDYGPAGTMPRASTHATSGVLAYDYEALDLPGQPVPPLPDRPPVRQRTTGGVKVIGGSFLALGQTGKVSLDERSFSIEVPVSGTTRKQSKALLSNEAPGAGEITSLSIAFADVRLTEAGADGGYFYKVYVNMPAHANAGTEERRYLVGTIGAFEIEAARHLAHDHADAGMLAPVQLDFSATALLRGQGPDALSKLVVSVVRFDGDNAPKGSVIEVGDLRIVASTAAIE